MLILMITDEDLIQHISLSASHLTANITVLVLLLLALLMGVLYRLWRVTIIILHYIIYLSNERLQCKSSSYKVSI